MSKKKRYEYRERNREEDFGFREKHRSHKMKPIERWRKTDLNTINYTGDDYDEQEEWSAHE
jgi:hypothetical protein